MKIIAGAVILGIILILGNYLSSDIPGGQIVYVEVPDFLLGLSLGLFGGFWAGILVAQKLFEFGQMLRAFNPKD